MEILPQTQNFEEEDIICFHTNPVEGTTYCYDRFEEEWYFENPSDSYLCIEGNYLSPSGYQGDPDYGFDFCNNNNGYPKFWSCINKITVNYNNYAFIFYVDYRDCNYGNYGQDITIRYLKDVGLYLAPGLITESSLENFRQVGLYSMYRIGEINNYPNYCTEELPDFWQNCLVLIPTSDNHSRLVWGPYPERKQGSCSLFC
jgi:hypothetical protein